MLKGLHEFADDRYQETIGDEISMSQEVCRYKRRGFKREKHANKFYDAIKGTDLYEDSGDYGDLFYVEFSSEIDDEIVNLYMEYTFSAFDRYEDYVIKEVKNKIKKIELEIGSVMKELDIYRDVSEKALDKVKVEDRDNRYAMGRLEGEVVAYEHSLDKVRKIKSLLNNIKVLTSGK